MNFNLLKILVLCMLVFSIDIDARKRKTQEVNEINISIDVADDFGKTHFIVGYPFEQVAKDRAKQIDESICAETFGLVCEGRIKQVYFAPDDSIQKLLLYLIKEEKKSIKLAAFSFTDGDIAQALLDAMHRGVTIEMIVDPGCIIDRFGKIKDLQESKIDIFVYNPNHAKDKKARWISSIMHNKFILFGSNVLDKKIIWTGSFNFTKSAHQRNQENVIVLDDELVITKYEQQFDRLKTRSFPPKNKKSTATARISKKGTIFEDTQAYA